MSNIEPLGVRTEVMLSTKDNPYDYFTHFNEWLAYDNEFGYNCCGYLDRIVTLRDEMTDDMTVYEVDAAIERAVDEIVSKNPLGIYIKVTRKVPND